MVKALSYKRLPRYENVKGVEKMLVVELRSHREKPSVDTICHLPFVIYFSVH